MFVKWKSELFTFYHILKTKHYLFFTLCLKSDHCEYFQPSPVKQFSELLLKHTAYGTRCVQEGWMVRNVHKQCLVFILQAQAANRPISEHASLLQIERRRRSPVFLPLAVRSECHQLNKLNSTRNLHKDKTLTMTIRSNTHLLEILTLFFSHFNSWQ